MHVVFCSFPQAAYPDLREPVSPFHPDGDEISNLSQQGQIMFEEIFDDRARRAVNSHIAQSIEEFRPDRAQCISMVAETFAAVIGSSPGPAQWVVNSSPETLRDAVTNRNRENGTLSTATSDPPGRNPEASHLPEELELSELVPPYGQESFHPLPSITAHDGSASYMQMPLSYTQQVNQVPMFMPVVYMMPVASTTQINQLVAPSTAVPTLLPDSSLDSISSGLVDETLGNDFVAEQMGTQDHIFSSHITTDIFPNAQSIQKVDGNEISELEDIDWSEWPQDGFVDPFP